jgi:UDP-3-O-[3-hydroxymyristoyl] glucosamine N-acyltransferase
LRFRSGVTAGSVANLVGGELIGTGERALAGVAALGAAGPGDLAFAYGPEGEQPLRATRAGAVIVPAGLRHALPAPSTAIVVDHPVTAAARAIELFRAGSDEWGVHPTASLGAGCTWRGRIRVDAHAVIGPAVTFGEDCRVGPGAVIEAGATIGDRCEIGPGATVHADVRLGNDVAIRTGARVGGAGFGFVNEAGRHQRVPQLAGCSVGDSVEIGANSTVDRGGSRDTEIGEGTKIDNLVQIAHNVRIGRHCVIMAQVGIAGTVTVEDGVLLAGQAGLADHLTVGRGARIAAQSGVIGDVPRGATVSGYPARDHRAVLRQSAALARLTPLVTDIERIVQRDE